MRPRIGEQRARQPRARAVEALAREIEDVGLARQAARGGKETVALRLRGRGGACSRREGRSVVTVMSRSARTGTARSAAAVGVGARQSATRSISVQSVSWPTAEISGMALAATARATISSLKPQRSSRLPPPRATIIRSGRGIAAADASALKPAMAAATSARAGLALHPHRPHQHVAGKAVAEAMQDVADHRAGRRGDHADDARQIGQRPLARVGEQALGGEHLLALLEQRHQRADAGRLQLVDDDLVFRLAGIGGDAAGERSTSSPASGLNLRRAKVLRQITASMRGVLVLQREIAVARAMRALDSRRSRRAA